MAIQTYDTAAVDAAVQTAGSIYSDKRHQSLPPMHVFVAGGSAGIGHLTSRIEDGVVIPYEAIGVPDKVISGQQSGLLIGGLRNEKGVTPVGVMLGRQHFYQGYTDEQIAFIYRVSHGLVQATNTAPTRPILISTHAVGAINPNKGNCKDLETGDILITESPIYLHDPNRPLTGQPDWVPEFQNLTNEYDPYLRALAAVAAEKAGVPYKTHGISIVLPGPKFETPAEISYLRAVCENIGHSGTPMVVGMSGNEHYIAHSLKPGFYIVDLAAITNGTVGLEKIRAMMDTPERQKALIATMKLDLPFYEARTHAGYALFDRLGPTHEEVKAMQDITGKRLEGIISELIPMLNLQVR